MEGVVFDYLRLVHQKIRASSFVVSFLFIMHWL